ncbi:MAG: hypothetical protein AAGG44_17205 [Planctomycetota bacterium]
MRSRRCNPFATRYVRPGAIPWVGDANARLDSIHKRFETLGERAAVIGPHGSGKTTLLHHLVPRLLDEWEFIAPDGTSSRRTSDGLKPGRPAGKGTGTWIQLRRCQTHGVCELRPWPIMSRGQLLVLDGLEQLYWHQRFFLLADQFCRRYRLLVTSHRPSWQIPELWNTSVDAATAVKIIQHISDASDPGDSGRLELSTNELRERLARENGSLREVLMQCYDEYEQTTQSQSV